MSWPTIVDPENTLTAFSFLLLQYATPFLGVGIISYTLVTNDIQLFIVSSFVTIPLIAAPLGYWFLEEVINDRVSASPLRDRQSSFRFSNASTIDVLRLGKLYIILYSISVFAAVITETRPLVYVVIASVMATVILVQSLFATTHTHRWLVLLETSLLLGNLILTMTLKYHYFIGGTDLILHAEWARQISETGHTSEVMDVYESYPLWHFIVAFGDILFDGALSVHRVMVLMSGLIFLSLPTAVYCIFRRISGHYSLSLLASVFVSLNPLIIYYGMYATPRSIVSILFAVFLFTCHVRVELRWIGLVTLLTTGMVVFHPASPPFILAVLCLYGVSVTLSSRTDLVFNWSFVVIFVLVTALYWMYAAPGIVETLVDIFDDSISPDDGPASSATVSEDGTLSTATADLFNNGVYAFLIFFSLFGALESFRSERSRYYPVLVTGLVLIPLSVPGLSLLIPDMTTTLNFDRWGQYTYVFLACSTAIGFYAIVNRLLSKRTLLVLLILLLVPFFSVGNIYVIGDNPVATSETHTPYLTTEETTALSSVDEFSSNYVLVDYVSHRYLSTTVENSSAHILEADDSGTLIPRDVTTEDLDQTDDIYFFRMEELDERGLKIYYPPSNEFELEPTYRDSLGNFRNIKQLKTVIEQNNKVYDSDSTTGVYHER